MIQILPHIQLWFSGFNFQTHFSGVHFCKPLRVVFQLSISNPLPGSFFIHSFSVLVVLDSIFKSLAGPRRFFKPQFQLSFQNSIFSSGIQTLACGFSKLWFQDSILNPLRLRVVFQHSIFKPVSALVFKIPFQTRCAWFFKLPFSAPVFRIQFQHIII